MARSKHPKYKEKESLPVGTELHTPHPAPPQCPLPGALVVRSARPGTGSISGVILAHGEGMSCSSPQGQGQARSRWSPWLHLPAEGFVFPPKKKKRKNKCIERSLVRRRVVVSCSTHSWRLCPGQGRCTPGCSSSVYWGGQALAPAHAWPPPRCPRTFLWAHALQSSGRAGHCPHGCFTGCGLRLVPSLRCSSWGCRKAAESGAQPVGHRPAGEGSTHAYLGVQRADTALGRRVRSSSSGGGYW